MKPPAAETTSALGRYRASALTRWATLAISPVVVLDAVRSPDPLTIAVAVAGTSLALVSWLVPNWIITTREVRRPLLRHSYSLSDVEAVTVGRRSGAVVLKMRDGDRVRLSGLPQAVVPDLVRLASSARAATHRDAAKT